MSLNLDPILSIIISLFSPFLLWWCFDPSTFYGIIIMVLVHVILSHVLWRILYRRIN